MLFKVVVSSINAIPPPSGRPSKCTKNGRVPVVSLATTVGAEIPSLWFSIGASFVYVGCGISWAPRPLFTAFTFTGQFDRLVVVRWARRDLPAIRINDDVKRL
jgi:hypothetical protein